jgi:deoxycytidylate deaminase
MTRVVAFLGAAALAESLHGRLTAAGLTTLVVDDPATGETAPSARGIAVAAQIARRVSEQETPPAVALVRIEPDVSVMATVRSVFASAVVVVQTDGGHEHGRFFDQATFTLGPADAPDLDRLVDVLTARPHLRPNRYEQALYLAKAASLRSAGLRGGIGCVLLDQHGDVLAAGANEVPRGGGGQYWCDSPDDSRDFHHGQDPAYVSKQATVLALLGHLTDRGLYRGDDESVAADCVDFLDGNGTRAGLPSTTPAVQGFESLGRVVHAELAALAAATRHGTSVVGCEAVVTAPPCRQCLRQLIVSGVRAVRYLGTAAAGAYAFHADAITADPTEDDRMLVVPFVGVTPRGYVSAFSASTRDTGGSAPVSWRAALELVRGAAPLEEAVRVGGASAYGPDLVAYLNSLRRDLADRIAGGRLDDVPGAARQ